MGKPQYFEVGIERSRIVENPKAYSESDIQPEVEAQQIATAEETFRMILRLVRIVQSGMQSIDPGHNLSGSQLWALWQISALPGLRVAELAASLHIRQSTASNLLDKLESRGLVRRERSTTDNRVVRLYLTESADNVVTVIPGPMQGRLRYRLREMPSPVLQGLLDGLSLVLASLGESVSAPSNRS